jgi:hypothetical protein
MQIRQAVLPSPPPIISQPHSPAGYISSAQLDASAGQSLSAVAILSCVAFFCPMKKPTNVTSLADRNWANGPGKEMSQWPIRQ